MPTARKATKSAVLKAKAKPVPPSAVTVLVQLKKNASKKYREDMATRYGIVTMDKVIGVPMAKLKLIAKGIGRDHALAEALWETGIYDARMLATLVGEPEQVTPAQMDIWAKDADNWALVDTFCFNLFDRTPYVFAKIKKWSKAKDEFVKRAAFALLASVALHKRGEDDDFLFAFALIEKGASDERNFVKKGVSWALRAIGTKRGAKLRGEARKLARKLSASEVPSVRWVGRDALREFAKKD